MFRIRNELEDFLIVFQNATFLLLSTATNLKGEPLFVGMDLTVGKQLRSNSRAGVLVEKFHYEGFTLSQSIKQYDSIAIQFQLVSIQYQKSIW